MAAGSTGHPRSPTAADQALFDQIKAEFARRIMAEGCQVVIRAVEVRNEDEYTFFVVAQGIAWTVKFEPDEENKVTTFTIEKTKKKSSCTIL